MKVSVIVPFWNVEMYIERCLSSLINQTLKDIEIIVVNDGSPDNSEKIVKRLMKNNNNIKYIKQENGGLSSARNKGLKKATGKYVVFIDSDDFVEHDMLEKLYKKMEDNKADIATCDIRIYDEKKFPYLNRTKNINKYDNVSVWNKMYKKDLLDNINFPNNRNWYEDLYFNSILYIKAQKIVYVNEALVNYNVTNNSIMRNQNSEKNLDIIHIIENIKDYFIKNNLDRELKIEISEIITSHILINAISRVSLHDTAEKKEVLGKLHNYVLENNVKYKETNYYKTTSKKRKLIAFLNYNQMYLITRFLLVIKNNIS